ncbi:hypothetical protein HN695_06145 [Candidatus Woesearchaeota archaeon]|jgi:hypothetical protein|nr:hypothetical protein [Candidatus Woesearchaeota archaeon]MBT5272699.1 hypothetical protein [Candidatus Woesearchaeota archaeon]MBT6040310.1 hypothetical protein [Candidatus Woesearchaeota archaeon]MBT6337056.1 hypothetical protein [Candidatus Woesearchaeota archaeon]MBT7927890.1 hypothetical protein [Candidatus Woesearchaeota archaeon]
MMQKKYKQQRFLTIIIILAIVFVVGILLGKHLETRNQEEVVRFIKHLELNTESFFVEQELIGETLDCSLAKERINALSTELYDIGLLLTNPNTESSLGKENFALLKKKFHLMQIRTYLLYQSSSENCDSEEHIVLFYYGRDNKDSKEQGHILDEVVKNYDVNVFAIEFNYTKELTFLEGYYNITGPPAVVIDHTNVNNELTSYEEIVNSIS